MNYFEAMKIFEDAKEAQRIKPIIEQKLCGVPFRKPSDFQKLTAGAINECKPSNRGEYKCPFDAEMDADEREDRRLRYQLALCEEAIQRAKLLLPIIPKYSDRRMFEVYYINNGNSRDIARTFQIKQSSARQRLRAVRQRLFRYLGSGKTTEELINGK